MQPVESTSWKSFPAPRSSSLYAKQFFSAHNQNVLDSLAMLGMADMMSLIFVLEFFSLSFCYYMHYDYVPLLEQEQFSFIWISDFLSILALMSIWFVLKSCKRFFSYPSFFYFLFGGTLPKLNPWISAEYVLESERKQKWNYLMQ